MGFRFPEHCALGGCNLKGLGDEGGEDEFRAYGQADGPGIGGSACAVEMVDEGHGTGGFGEAVLPETVAGVQRSIARDCKRAVVCHVGLVGVGEPRLVCMPCGHMAVSAVVRGVRIVYAEVEANRELARIVDVEALLEDEVVDGADVGGVADRGAVEEVGAGAVEVVGGEVGTFRELFGTEF